MRKQRGQIVTVLTLIALGVMTAGVFVGAKVVQKPSPPFESSAATDIFPEVPTGFQEYTGTVPRNWGTPWIAVARKCIPNGYYFNVTVCRDHPDRNGFKMEFYPPPVIIPAFRDWYAQNFYPGLIHSTGGNNARVFFEPYEFGKPENDCATVPLKVVLDERFCDPDHEDGKKAVALVLRPCTLGSCTGPQYIIFGIPPSEEDPTPTSTLTPIPTDIPPTDAPGTPTPTPFPCSQCDVTGDDCFDQTDVDQSGNGLSACFNQPVEGDCSQWDVNGDEVINITDFSFCKTKCACDTAPTPIPTATPPAECSYHAQAGIYEDSNGNGRADPGELITDPGFTATYTKHDGTLGEESFGDDGIIPYHNDNQNQESLPYNSNVALLKDGIQLSASTEPWQIVKSFCTPAIEYQDKIYESDFPCPSTGGTENPIGSFTVDCGGAYNYGWILKSTCEDPSLSWALNGVWQDPWGDETGHQWCAVQTWFESSNGQSFKVEIWPKADGPGSGRKKSKTFTRQQIADGEVDHSRIDSQGRFNVQFLGIDRDHGYTYDEIWIAKVTAFDDTGACQNTIDKDWGMESSCYGGSEPPAATATPVPECKEDINGNYNDACCCTSSDCPTNASGYHQKCNIDNGSCKSNKSCNPNEYETPGTPTPTPTPIGDLMDCDYLAKQSGYDTGQCKASGKSCGHYQTEIGRCEQGGPCCAAHFLIPTQCSTAAESLGYNTGECKEFGQYCGADETEIGTCLNDAPCCATGQPLATPTPTPPPTTEGTLSVTANATPCSPPTCDPEVVPAIITIKIYEPGTAANIIRQEFVSPGETANFIDLPLDQDYTVQGVVLCQIYNNQSLQWSDATLISLTNNSPSAAATLNLDYITVCTPATGTGMGRASVVDLACATEENPPDGMVNTRDYVTVISTDYFECGENLIGDINGDGCVNAIDLSQLIRSIGVSY